MGGKITIETSESSREAEWNEFVEASTNGTIFHRLDFLDYHPEDRFDEAHLMFYYGGQNLIGVLSLAFEEEDGKTVARSPYGGSYGGLVVEPDVKFRYVEEMVDRFLEYLRERCVDDVVIRPTPREQHLFPSAYFESHLLNSGFSVSDSELTSVVDLRRISNDRFNIYERSCRSKVRKADRKGVEIVEWSDEWGEFHDILLATQARHDKTPTHTHAELERLAEMFPDRVRLCMAYHDDTPVAGLLEFLINKRTNFHFYNCHRIEHRDLAPINLLLDREIEWSIQHGYDFLDLGTTVERFEWNPGLMRFKESFGATGHFRKLYRLSL